MNCCTLFGSNLEKILESLILILLNNFNIQKSSNETTLSTFFNRNYRYETIDIQNYRYEWSINRKTTRNGQIDSNWYESIWKFPVYRLYLSESIFSVVIYKKMGFWSSFPCLRSCSKRFVYSTSRRSRSTEFGTTEAGVTSHVFPSNSSKLRNPIFLSLLGILAGTVALQSKPSLAFCLCLYNDTKVSQSLESEFVYSLIFYRFSLVSKQKICLVSLLLFL
jgi:hypothetical protein